MEQRPRIERGQKYLLWDGDCGFCARSIELAARLNRGGVILAPYQAFGESELRAVGLTPRQCAREVKAVTAEGHVYGGAFAVNYFLWHNGAWRVLVALFYAFPILALAEVVAYRAVAANRAKLSQVLGGASCALPHSTPKENP
jgi:predicted DCC family thiol-disulfide oxidoreductase YuxK